MSPVESDIDNVIHFYINKSGLTEQEASTLADRVIVSKELYFTLHHAADILVTIFHDSITGDRYAPPKKMPARLITFGDGVRNFTLYISEASGEAILSEYIPTEEVAWVDLQFGMCRKVR